MNQLTTKLGATMKITSMLIIACFTLVTFLAPTANALDFMVEGFQNEREHGAKVGIDLMSIRAHAGTTGAGATGKTEVFNISDAEMDDADEGWFSWKIALGVVVIVAVAIAAGKTSDSGNRNGTSGTTDQANDESITTALSNALRGSEAGGDINATFNINVQSTVAPLE
jgi:hypothetical protein